jgi:hypothetical protein
VAAGRSAEKADAADTLTTEVCCHRLAQVRAVLTRVMPHGRREHRRPAHAMSSPKRTKRPGIRNLQNCARHAAEDRVRNAKAVKARLALAQIRNRVTRVTHASRVAELGVAPLAAREWVWELGVRAARARAFCVFLITCLLVAGVLAAEPSPRPTVRPLVRPPPRATSQRAPVPTASGTSSGSQFDAGKQTPRGDAPRTGAASPVGDLPSQTSEGPGHDLSLDIQGLPPAPADPDLEAALSDLDKQADLDQLMWQQRGLGQRPPVPTAGSPTAPPGAQVPDAPRPATSTTASAPQSSPPTTVPRDENPTSGGDSEQPARSAPGAR